MNKYHNKPIIIDGIKFASTREGNRWQELRLLERAGEIRDLKRQVRFKVVDASRTVSGELLRPVYYVADFVYRDKRGMTVVEDVKGVRTAVYTIKKKLMNSIYGYEIKEI